MVILLHNEHVTNNHTLSPYHLRANSASQSINYQSNWFVTNNQKSTAPSPRHNHVPTKSVHSSFIVHWRVNPSARYWHRIQREEEYRCEIHAWLGLFKISRVHILLVIRMRDPSHAECWPHSISTGGRSSLCASLALNLMVTTWITG